MNELEARLQSLVTTREQLERQEAILASALAELQSFEEGIRRELIPVIESLDQALREYQKINARRAEEERQLEAENRRVEQITADLNASLEGTRQQLDAHHEEMESLHRAIEDLNGTRSRTDEELQAIIARIRDLRDRYECLLQASEEMSLQRDAAARSRSLLRRLDRDRSELAKLAYGRTLTYAAEAYEQHHGSAQE
jgi:chromosome segregation ATPase